MLRKPNPSSLSRLLNTTVPPVDEGMPKDGAECPPPRPHASASLLVLAVLAVVYTLWAAQELILPILLAIFFALVGNPIIRLLNKLYLPRFLGALLVLTLGIVAAFALGRELVQPASEWLREAPRELSEITPKLRNLVKPMREASKAAETIARTAGGESSKSVQVVKTAVDDPYRMLAATPKAVAAVLAVVLMTFFFMVYGGRLQQRAIALLPSRHQQRLTVEITQVLEHEISRYVLTISVINALFGVAFAAGLYFFMRVPFDEALLWGSMAALLNFAPYIGPLLGMIVMLLMGFVSYDGLWPALLPAVFYLGLHTLEGQLITPIVLGKRMALSPLVLVLGLILFGGLWGIIGLLLAVPLLACVKIVLERIGMEGWARLLE